MRGKQDQQVVEVYFPDGELKNLNVHEMIRSYYDVEIVNYDRLLIKVSFILTYTSE